MNLHFDIEQDIIHMSSRNDEEMASAEFFAEWY